ncbi:MAG TPA: MmgE/PrpD family protein [Acidimicrobiales bacterium]|nr:MmgE/PrpD family protein [Acidimicrobiales bacterium]
MDDAVHEEAVPDEVSPETFALARHIASAPGRELPAEVAERGRMHLLDSLASAVSGRSLEAGQRGLAWLEATAPAVGPATVLGTSRRAAPFAAALANGMAAHADETDDSHQASLTHPGCSVLPAALAAAEAAGASGATLLRAVVVGYDVAARVGATVRSAEQHRDAGRWASHPVIGTFAATAAAAAAAGLDETQVRHLLSYAADLASGVTTWVRDTHHVEKAFVFAGMPASNALLATSLVAAGCDGVEDVFSSSPNWLEAAHPGAERGGLVAGLGSDFGVMGATVKKYAVGSPSQAAVEAMVTLIGRGLTAEETEEVAVHLAPEGLVVVNDRKMPNVNAQYLLAGTLVDGAFSMRMAHDAERLASPEIRAVMARITLVPDESLRGTRAALLRVRRRDGSTLKEDVRAVRGTPADPMSFEEVAVKAADLLSGALGAPAARHVVELCSGIETLRDLAPLQGALVGR